MTTKSQVQVRVNRAVELFLDQKTNPGALSKVSTEHLVQGIAEYLLEEIEESRADYDDYASQED